MTVQELINELNKIEDKSKTVYNLILYRIDEIEENESDVIRWYSY